MGIEIIASKSAVNRTNAQRTDLPPLVAYDAVSIWAKQVVNKKTGAVTVREQRYLNHPIGKVGAGLNAALDRIHASFAARENKGYNDLEGFDFVALAVVPADK